MLSGSLAKIPGEAWAGKIQGRAMEVRRAVVVVVVGGGGVCVCVYVCTLLGAAAPCSEKCPSLHSTHGLNGSGQALTELTPGHIFVPRKAPITSFLRTL